MTWLSKRKPLRVLVFFPDLELGGAERQALLLSQYLLKDGRFQVFYVGFTRPGNRLTDELDQMGIKWYLIEKPQPGRWWSIAKFMIRLRRFRPTVMLPYLFATNVWSGTFWPWSGAKACIWNQRDEGIGYHKHAYLQKALQRTSCFVTNSTGGRLFLNGTLGVPDHRIVHIRNGVVLPDPAEEVRQAGAAAGLRATWGDDAFVACMVGNLHLNKDHFTLLKAWQQVKLHFDRQGRKCLLLVAGKPYQTYPQLLSLAGELQLGDSLKFLGQVADVGSLWKSVDLCVHSSKSEGSPNAVLEAMAAGLAVAATDIPGVRDAVCEENLPLLAPVEDAPALAERVIDLAGNHARRAHLGRLNQARIRALHAPELMGKAYVELIRQLT